MRGTTRGHGDKGTGGGYADCWAFVVAKAAEMSRGRVRLPERFAEALRVPEAIADEVPAGVACVRGDLIEMITEEEGRPRRHVAIALGAFKALHYVRSVGEVLELDIATARRARAIVRVVRPRGTPSLSPKAATSLPRGERGRA